MTGATVSDDNDSHDHDDHSGDPTAPARQIDELTARLLIGYVQEGTAGHAGGLARVLAAADLTAGGYRVRDLGLLLRLSYLLSPGTAAFLTAAAARLRHVRPSTHRRPAELVGHVRGAINWSRTVPVQVTRPSTYVCADPHRSFDDAPNRRLKALVERLAADAAQVAERWDGVAVRRSSARTGWRAALDQTRAALGVIRRNPTYRAIGPVPAGLVPVPARARSVDLRSPIAALTVAETDVYHDVVTRTLATSEGRRRLVEGFRWPEPNKRFELFVLFRLGELLRQHPAMRAAELVPIAVATTAADRWFLRLSAGPRTVTVHYQLAPAGAVVRYYGASGDASIDDYANTMMAYDARFAQLRPDVTVESHDVSTGCRRVLLVEVKRSDDPNTLRQGLRELVDYRLLYQQPGVGPNDIRGLLCVYAAPAIDVDLGNGQPFRHGHAITTAERLLAGDAPELAVALDFCWSA